MLLRIFVMYVQNTFHLQTVSKQKHDHLAQEIKHYIIANYNKQITIEELCSYFFCSRGTLLKHFKSKYNTTVHQYLLDYRLKKAAELLINDELNVKEIAYFCGFEDPNYFSKAFRKKYNLSPLKFKNQQIEKDYRQDNL